MAQSLTASKSIVIMATPQRVWRALTDPEQIKQYMFGSEVETDWQEGSPIVYRGTWDGKPYEDKGTILKIAEPQLLRSSYYSPLSGKADTPENYAEVTYQLSPEAGGTMLTVTQTNNADDAAREQAEGNWSSVLDAIKSMIEN